MINARDFAGLLLVTGLCWIIVSWFVLALNRTGINEVGVLVGVVLTVAGAAELFHMFTAPAWRWLHLALGVIFIATGLASFAHPFRTFAWLAALVGWYLLIKGAADVILAFMTMRHNEAWWLGLLVGIVEIILGFWATGRFNRSVYALIVLVAAVCLVRGITDIVMAFRVRGLERSA